jgi:tetratricopeptide (TPR) repeat protein
MSSAAWPQNDLLAACERNLRALSRGLTRHQAENGNLPSELQELHPRFVRDRAAFHCPADHSEGTPGFGAGQTDSFPTSYLYEMSGRPDSSGSQFLGPPPEGKNLTWRDVKLHQQTWFGDRVPAVRCRHHDQVINLTLGGKIYVSDGVWETHPSTLAEVLNSYLRDIAGGREQFLKRWSIPLVADYFRALRRDNSVVPALRAKLRSAAGKTLSALSTGSEEKDGPVCLLAGVLYFSSGDLDRAMPAFERAAVAEPDGPNQTAVNKLGEIYEVSRRADRPIRFYRRLAELYPEEPLFLRKVADAYDAAGQTALAEQWRRRAVQLEAERKAARPKR